MSIGREIARLDESIGSTLPDFDNISAKNDKKSSNFAVTKMEERFLQILCTVILIELTVTNLYLPAIGYLPVCHLNQHCYRAIAETDCRLRGSALVRVLSRT